MQQQIIFNFSFTHWKRCQNKTPCILSKIDFPPTWSHQHHTSSEHSEYACVSEACSFWYFRSAGEQFVLRTHFHFLWSQKGAVNTTVQEPQLYKSAHTVVLSPKLTSRSEEYLSPCKKKSYKSQVCLMWQDQKLKLTPRRVEFPLCQSLAYSLKGLQDFSQASRKP